MVEVPKVPAWQVSTKQRTRARGLRRDMTEAEKIIWKAILPRKRGREQAVPVARPGLIER